MASLTNDSTIYNAGLPGAGYALEIPPLDNFGALLIGSFVGLALVYMAYPLVHFH